MELNYICNNMRKDCLTMAKAAGTEGFHFGASFSLIEIIASLYFEVMDRERDRFILSKGHGVPAVYAALHQLNVIADEELSTFKNNGSELSGHPTINDRFGFDVATGSLGQGLSIGVGKALAVDKDTQVYVVLGDGECDEGSVWEAAMMASKHQLYNLTVVIDCNGLQYDGDTDDVMPLDNLEEKWKSFGFEVITVDGHKVKDLVEAFRIKSNSKPMAIIAKTIKGKGISFMENNAKWHHGIMNAEQEKQAIVEVYQDGI